MNFAMVVPLLILAASALSAPSATEPVRPSGFRPTTSASAHATARIQVISGVKFGQDYAARPAGADRRSTLLTDVNGQVRPAELLEFQ